MGGTSSPECIHFTVSITICQAFLSQPSRLVNNSVIEWPSMQSFPWIPDIQFPPFENKSTLHNTNNAGRSSPDSPSYSHALRRRWLLICSALLTDEILQHHVRCYRVPSAFMQMLLVLFYMRHAVFHIRFESHSVNSCDCIGVPYTIPVFLYHLPGFWYWQHQRGLHHHDTRSWYSRILLSVGFLHSYCCIPGIPDL